MENYEIWKKRLQEEVLCQLDCSREWSDEEVQEVIVQIVWKQKQLDYGRKKKLAKEIFHAVRRLDILEELMEDKSVTEIMINGPDCIFIEREGRLSPLAEHFESREKLEDVIQQIVAECNRTVNEASPIVDARLKNGSRIHVVLPPVALNGPIMTVRRFPDRPYTMQDLIGMGTLSREMADWLADLVRARYNIFISGGTGSGKTTFLNALSGYIPKDERIITIEDSAELQLNGIANLVRLEARNAVLKEGSSITIRELIKASLRMRPDRVIVGEIRGEEAIDMIQALNTGHDGSLSTGHANSAADMLSRMETMVLMGLEIPLAAVRMQIVSAIDIIVHLGRVRDKSRKVLEIAEVAGMEDGMVQIRTLYRFCERGDGDEDRKQKKVCGEWVLENPLTHTAKLEAAGIL
ncbi:MAG: CpaF family protein [Lachnospiraceae bacterium]|nr:CpaF family protein [Lachnospiraceae bacterium]